MAERNWPEDFHFENGKYYNICHICNESFVGYKRRVVCKLCTISEANMPKLPWYIEPCGCEKKTCDKYSIMASATIDEISENCVIHGGWAKLTKEVSQFIVDCVNNLNPESLDSHPRPWHTELCWSEKKDQACWYFEIKDINSNVVVPHGEIDKNTASFIVRKVNQNI